MEQNEKSDSLNKEKSNELNNNQNQDQINLIEIINKKNENKKLNELLLINTIFYVFIFVVIGLPVWFLTTTVYRSSLPFDEINQAALLNKLAISVKIDFIFLDQKISNSKLNELKVNFVQTLKSDTEISTGLIFDFKVNFRHSKKIENELAINSNNINDFDNQPSLSNLNSLQVFIFDQNLSEKFKISDINFVFMNNLYVNPNSLKDLKVVANFIKTQYVNSKQLEEIYSSKLNIDRKMLKKEEFKVINFDNSYEIVFTLINTIPETQKSDWNIDYCIQNYFKNIVKQLSPFANFSMKAQTLFYTEFDSHPVTKVKLENQNDGVDKYYFHIKESDLSIMTNHIESRLGSRISHSSALEFVTYIPRKQPLYISQIGKNPLESKINSFLVPRWGGIYIYNKENSTDSKSINSDKAFKVFLTQFINLIGVRLNKNPKQILRDQIYSSEIYGYLLTKTVSNLLDSINTLKSLSLLLTKISSMVIEDDIAEKIKISIDSVNKCIDYLNNGNIEEAFFQSKNAFSSSEKAFFDQSLLEKLYFPDDQKFAIYIPLFIPIGIPVLLSIKSIIIFLKKNRNLENKAL